MKKILALCLAVLMLLTTLPLGASAESSAYDHDTLIALACEYFPEYESMIHGDVISSYDIPQSSNSREIVFSETRYISDTESIGITQFSNNEIIVIYGTADFTIKNTDLNISDVATDLIGNASYSVTNSVGSGTFYLNGVGFIINQNGNGYFTAYGTPNPVNGASYNTEKVVETTTVISYNISFPASKTQSDRFELYFYDGTLTAKMGGASDPRHD